MRQLILLLPVLFIYGCNNPKTVFICGDHVCINNTEAEQYFEDNLILEVKVIDNKSKNEIDLVELNLKSNSEEKKEISMLSKDNTRKPIKVLSNDEIERKKIELKKKKKIKNKKYKKTKKIKNKKYKKAKKIKKTVKKEKSNKIIKKANKVVNVPEKKISDVCAILEKCSIDEISKFLVKQGKEKKYPDITIRENK